MQQGREIVTNEQMLKRDHIYGYVHNKTFVQHFLHVSAF